MIKARAVLLIDAEGVSILVKVCPFCGESEAFANVQLALYEVFGSSVQSLCKNGPYELSTLGVSVAEGVDTCGL